MIAEFKGKYYFLSNFFPTEVEYAGRIFPSSEHAYMSAKSNDVVAIPLLDGSKEMVLWKDYCTRESISAGDIKKMSRTVNLIDDWDNAKFHVMYGVLCSKFSKEPLKQMLLDTGNENLQEGNTWGDRIWGIDLKVNPNVGENFLGRLLMKLRRELKLEQQTKI